MFYIELYILYLKQIHKTTNYYSYFQQLVLIVIPYVPAIPVSIFQQDNPWRHIACVLVECFKSRNLTILPWHYVLKTYPPLNKYRIWKVKYCTIFVRRLYRGPDFIEQIRDEIWWIWYALIIRKLLISSAACWVMWLNEQICEEAHTLFNQLFVILLQFC